MDPLPYALLPFAEPLATDACDPRIAFRETQADSRSADDPQAGRPFHPNDRETMLRFFRAKASVPFEEPSSLDAGKCVIPFGYHEDRRMGRVLSERAAHQEGLRLMRERRRREARAREPWENGEWAG